VAERVSDNVAMLMRVVERIAPLRDRLVFLGGAVTELLIPSPGRSSSRQTKDVDVTRGCAGPRKSGTGKPLLLFFRCQELRG